MWYKVHGRAELFLEVEIEAGSETEAIELARGLCTELTQYAGNGSVDMLVGTDEPNISIQPADEIEWYQADALEED